MSPGGFTVREQPRPLEPCGRDPFADGLEEHRPASPPKPVPKARRRTPNWARIVRRRIPGGGA